jgi:putative (di)nucleoside polyphosphate hydrolase
VAIKYRDNVCAVILEKEGRRLLMCHRINCQPHEGWQFPQGGIDPRCDLVAELKRELREEIGTDAIRVIRISKKSFKYDFPPKARDAHPGYRGQRQRWVFAEFIGAPGAIRFDSQPAEFDAFVWVEPEDVIQKVIDFKRDTYIAALRDLKIFASTE